MKKHNYSLCTLCLLSVQCLSLFFAPCSAQAATWQQPQMIREIDTHLLKNDSTLVGKALQDGANPNAVNKYGVTVFTAFLSKNWDSLHREEVRERLRLLLKAGADITQRDKADDGLAQLELFFITPSVGLFDILDALMEESAQIGSLDEYRDPYMKLILAIATGAPFSQMQKAIQNGASFNSEFGRTSLFMYAIQKNRLDAVSEYIRLGGGVNSMPANATKTPLMHAIIHNVDIKIIKVLLDNGADVHSRDKFNGKTALQYADEYKNNNATALIRKAMEATK